jgi:two-component system, NarL family, nitrate/nitrite response regulator NarL
MTAASVRELRVLIADDHAPTRDDVRRALTSGGMKVCAEAADAARAVQKAIETKPDICLLDLRMPGGGVAAAWEIAARLPTTKIVVLTVSDDDTSLFSALRAGAVGYLVKDLDLRLLPRALEDVAAGRAAIPRALVARMVKHFHATDPRFRTTTVSGELGTRLTSREWDVLAALADGLSTREIGRRLQLKPSGVRAHISALVRKLGVADREEATAFFRATTD